jgi:hypothetical protein
MHLYLGVQYTAFERKLKVIEAKGSSKRIRDKGAECSVYRLPAGSLNPLPQNKS